MTPRGLLERLADFQRRLFAPISPWEIGPHFLLRSVFFGTVWPMTSALRADVETKVAAAEAAMTREGLTTDEALQQALILEGSELNSLDDAWISGFRPALGALMQAMMPEEEAYISRLVKAVQEFSMEAAL